MRVTVVSAKGDARGAEELADLGCAVRELTAMAAPQDITAHTDLIFIEADRDGELGRFVVERVRSADARLPVLLALAVSQLSRVDPAWGHDDFLVMPYSPAELVARLRAAEWRTSEFSQPELIKIGGVLIDVAAHSVRHAGAFLALPNREFELLLCLARARGRVLRRDQILASVWKQRGGGAGRSLDVHVRRLRARFAGAVQIETVRGVGYRLEAPA